MADTPLPDNLISRIGRISVVNKSFKNDAGENITYSRLVLSGQIKNEDFVIETKIEQKDIMLLKFADVVDDDRFGDEE